MKQFLQIMRRYLSPYKSSLVWAVVLNIYSQVMNVVSFVVLIPILNILFQIDQKVYHYQEWTWSTLNKDLLVNNGYAYVQELMATVGLDPRHLERYPHAFSGGQRQRIGVARALIMQPDFIIADEPISALDVSIRAQVLNLLSELQKERGLTYLFISHDLSVMRFICDRIAVIHKGVLVELAETEKLFAHPLHPYTRALLSAIPLPDPAREKNKKLEVYDPTQHDYSVDKPSWVEIEEGHMIWGNEKEIGKYREMLRA